MKETLLKIFQSYIKSVWKTKFIFILIFWVIVSLILTLEPLIFTQIIKKLELYFKWEQIDLSSIFTFIIFRWVFIILSTLIQYLYDYFFILKSTIKNYSDINIEYSKKVIHMEYSDYLWKKQWSLYKIIDKWCQDQESFFYFFFRDLLKNISSITFIIIILLYIDFTMWIVVISLLPVMFFIWYIFFKQVFPKQRKVNIKRFKVFWTIWNILSNFMLTKSLTIEKQFKQEISNTLKNAMDEQLRLMKMWSLAYVYTSFLVMVSRLLVLWFWTYFVLKWSLSFAMLFLFFSYIWWIYFPLWWIFQRLHEVSKNLSSIKDLHEEFKDINLEDTEKGKTIKDIKWNIKFKWVNFKYIKWKKILKDLSFEINTWEKIAFVWDTWAWKSTIVNLILRFWDTKSGAIFLDWENINNLSKKSLRQHIWIVTQDNSLFNMSIKENLLFAKQKASKKEIEEALKKSESNFVFDLKDWIKTIIGERWLKLSWWEKQRLSIARLFLKDPKILILDEATSALDNKTEKLVHKALDKLIKGRTSIIIAHRLSTIQNADKIYVLEKWQIIESWKYDELIDKKWKLYELANPEKLVIS